MMAAAELPAPFDFMSLPTLVRDEIYMCLLPRRPNIWLKDSIFCPSPVYAKGPREVGSPELVNRIEKSLDQLQALAHWNVREQTNSYKPQHELQKFPALLNLRLTNHTIKEEVTYIITKHLPLWLRLSDGVRAFVDATLKVPKAPLPTFREVPNFHLDQADMCNWPEEERIDLNHTVWTEHVAKLNVAGLLRWMARFRHVHALVEERFVTRIPRLVRTLTLSSSGAVWHPTLDFVVCGFRECFRKFSGSDPMFGKHGKGKLPQCLTEVGGSVNMAQVGEPDLFLIMPEYPRAALEEYGFYRILWQADMLVKMNKVADTGEKRSGTMKDMETIGSNNKHKTISEAVRISGSYIHSARMDVMSNLMDQTPHQTAEEQDVVNMDLHIHYTGPMYLEQVRGEDRPVNLWQYPRHQMARQRHAPRAFATGLGVWPESIRFETVTTGDSDQETMG